MKQASIYMVNLTNIHSLSLSLISDDALSAGAAAGVAFSVTFVLNAIITAIIVVLIIYFVFGCRSQSKYSPKNGVRSDSIIPVLTTTTHIYEDGPQSPSHKVNQSEFWQTKPGPAKKPDRPMAPPKPSVPAPKPPTPYNNGY